MVLTWVAGSISVPEYVRRSPTFSGLRSVFVLAQFVQLDGGGGGGGGGDGVDVGGGADAEPPPPPPPHPDARAITAASIVSLSSRDIGLPLVLRLTKILSPTHKKKVVSFDNPCYRFRR